MVTMIMERHVWTDERIDDMVERHDKSIDRLEKSIGLLRSDMHAGFERMGEGFVAIQRQLLHAVLVNTSMMIATMATLLATSL